MPCAASYQCRCVSVRSFSPTPRVSAGVSIVPRGVPVPVLQLREGGGNQSVAVVVFPLGRDPSTDYEISLTLSVVDTGGDGRARLRMHPNPLVFPPKDWDTPRVATIVAIQDSSPLPAATVLLSAALGAYNVADLRFSVNFTDDDVPGMAIVTPNTTGGGGGGSGQLSPPPFPSDDAALLRFSHLVIYEERSSGNSGSSGSSGGGGVGGYAVVLRSKPRHNVTVTLLPLSPQADAISAALRRPLLSIQPASLSLLFTPQQWAVPQLVRLHVAANDVASSLRVSIHHVMRSRDPLFATPVTGRSGPRGYGAAGTSLQGVGGVEPAVVNVTIVDDDVVGVSLSVASLSLTEGSAAVHNYTVRLWSQPLHAVTLSISLQALAVGDGSDPPAPIPMPLAVETASVVVQPQQWREGATVRVRALDDSTLNRRQRAVVLAHSLRSADRQYSMQPSAAEVGRVARATAQGSGSGSGSDNATATAAVSPLLLVAYVADDDVAAALRLSVAGNGAAVVEEGGRLSLVAAISLPPTAAVHVAAVVRWHSSGSGGAQQTQPQPDGGVASLTLTLPSQPVIPAGTADGNLSITLAVSQDRIAPPRGGGGGGRTAVVSVTLHSSDLQYDGRTRLLQVGVTDDDVSSVRLLLPADPASLTTQAVLAAAASSAPAIAWGAPRLRQLALVVPEGRAAIVPSVHAVVLTSQPTADVTVAATPPHGLALTVVPSQLTFSPSNWSLPRALYFLPPDDNMTDLSSSSSSHASAAAAAAADDLVRYSSRSADSGYRSSGGCGAACAPTVLLRVLDDDVAALHASPSVLQLREGQRHRRRVRLSLGSQPSSPVRVMPRLPVPGAAGKLLTVQPASAIIQPHQWSQGVWFSLLYPQDNITAPPLPVSLVWTTATAADSSGDREYASLVASTSVLLTNDDVAGVLLLTPPALSVVEGSNTSLQLRLSSQPRAPVTITASQSCDGSSPLIALTFTPLVISPSQWAQPHTVLMHCPSDRHARAQLTTTVTLTAHSALDSDYDHGTAALSASALSPTVSVTMVDRDTAGASLHPASIDLAEGGAPAPLALTLTSKPTHPVVVALSVTHDPPLQPGSSAIAVYPPSWTIDPSNWQQQHNVTVSAVDDNVAALESTTAILSLSLSSSGDASYNIEDAASLPFVTVTVSDNDKAGLSLSASSLPMLYRAGEAAAATEAWYNVSLTSEPLAAAVTITLSAAPTSTSAAPSVSLVPAVTPSNITVLRSRWAQHSPVRLWFPHRPSSPVYPALAFTITHTLSPKSYYTRRNSTTDSAASHWAISGVVAGSRESPTHAPRTAATGVAASAVAKHSVRVTWQLPPWCAGTGCGSSGNGSSVCRLWVEHSEDPLFTLGAASLPPTPPTTSGRHSSHPSSCAALVSPLRFGRRHFFRVVTTAASAAAPAPPTASSSSPTDAPRSAVVSVLLAASPSPPHSLRAERQLGRSYACDVWWRHSDGDNVAVTAFVLEYAPSLPLLRSQPTTLRLLANALASRSDGAATVYSHTVLGLPPSPVLFRVAAVNTVGRGAASVPSLPVPQRCVVGYYLNSSSGDGDGDQSSAPSPWWRCVKCPEGAVCRTTPTASSSSSAAPFAAAAVAEGGNSSHIRALAGWWRVPWSPHAAPRFSRCWSPTACLGEDPRHNLSTAAAPTADGSRCALGHSGVLCASCVRGFARQGGLRCNRCPDQTGNALVLCVAAAAALYYVVTTVRGSGGGGSGSAQLKVMKRTMLSHVQTISLAGAFPLSWPPVVRYMFRLLSALSSVADQLVSARCLLLPADDAPFADGDGGGGGIGGGDGDAPRFFFVSQAVLLTLPLLLFALVSLGFAAYALATRNRRHRRRGSTSPGGGRGSGQAGKSGATAVAPTIATVAPLSDGPSPTAPASAAITIRGVATAAAAAPLPRRSPAYSTTDHWVATILALAYMLFPALCRRTLRLLDCAPVAGRLLLRQDPAVRCYGERHTGWVITLFCPALLLYVLGFPLLCLSALHASKRRGQLRLPHSSACRRYAVLLSGYKPRYYWWEVTVLLRKALFAAVAVLLRPYGVQMQATAGLAVLLVALVTHVDAAPFLESSAATSGGRNRGCCHGDGSGEQQAGAGDHRHSHHHHPVHNLERWSLLTAMGTLMCGSLFMSGQLQPQGTMLLSLLLLLGNASFLLYGFVLYLAQRKRSMATAAAPQPRQ